MAQEDRKHGFLVYRNWKVFFDSLSDEDAGKLIKAIFNFQDTFQKDNDLPVSIQTVYLFMVSTFEIDQKKYDEKCAKNKEIANKRERKRKEDGLIDNPLSNM